MDFLQQIAVGLTPPVGIVGIVFSDIFTASSLLQIVSTVIDIALVWYLVYKLLTIIKGTKAVQLVKGIVLIFLVQWLSFFFELHTLHFIIKQIVGYGVLGIIIIFQPELRRALEQLGRGQFLSRISGYKADEALEEEIIVEAVDYMAKRRIGALIVLEGQTGLEEYIETGTPLAAAISKELLINLFIPNTPLHDGAVIIRKTQIAAAGCYLPLSESQSVSKSLGTRHRAAIGISEVTDSATIVVSEETGKISLARNGNLHPNLTKEQLLALLKDVLQKTEKESSTFTTFWTKRGKRNE